jgi:hypothetical protein
MSKIQEFITAWNTAVDAGIVKTQSEIDAYLAARQTAIAITDPFVLKMPTLEVLNIDPNGIKIPGFDVTTLGQLFDWSYPQEGLKAYDKYGNYRSKPEIVEDYIDRKYDVNDNLIVATSLYTEGYTYATMSYLAEEYVKAVANAIDISVPGRLYQNLINSLNDDSCFKSLESYKKLKNLGGKVWFDNWMRSLYSVISGTKISVSKLKASEYSNIFNRIEDVMRDNYLKGYYNEGARFKIDGINATAENSKYFQAILEAGDAFFPTQNSGTQSGTQSQGSGDYKLEVINPLSDNEKKINGKIVFIEDVQYLIANSTLNGLPNPWTNPVTNTVVPNNTGTITYNANKSTAGKSVLSSDIIINLQNIIQSTYGLTIYLKSTPQDTPTELPPPDSDVPVGSTASVESATASATASQVLPLQEFIFNVELQDIFSNTDFGNLFIIGKEDKIVFDDDQVDYSEYVEEEFTGEEEVLIKLSEESETYKKLQSEISSDTPPSTLNVSDSSINYNDPSFKGPEWKNFDINVAVRKIQNTEYKASKFIESLKKVLYLIKNDSQISDLREAAYLLGTAYAESSYSLQRWESDFICTGIGVPYGSSGPCSKATNYYRSTKGGKKNYYTLGLDSKGQCFFGRGLIQLTGKENYEIYGKLIGVNLLSNGDLALDPINAYKIASVYMRGAKTFKYVLANNLKKARQSVNGGTKSINEVNGAYDEWIKVLKESKSNSGAIA